RPSPGWSRLNSPSSGSPSMTRASIACVCLCLSLTLTACAGRAVVQPPKIIQIPTPVEQPAACKRLRAVDLPAGSAAQDVIETQARVIAEYEQQVITCTRP